jgi:glycerol-3-phosphate acyltransferase PlsY
VGVPVFVLDLLKGLIPVFVTSWYFIPPITEPAQGYPHGYLELGHLMIVLVGIGCILGHNFSCFLKFKGGKGVATSLGVCIAMSPVAGLIGFIVWVIVLGATRYISVASLVAVPIGSYVIWVTNDKAVPFAVFGISATVFSFVKHKPNIERLIAGTELKWGKKTEEPVS